MSAKTCLICRQRHPEETCEVFELTPEQEAVLRKRALLPPDEFVYCRRCWGLIGHPEIGPRLMRLTAERQMLSFGVPPMRAKQLADKYFTRLIELQRERHHKTH